MGLLAIPKYSFTKGLPCVELLPQRKYSTESPDSNFYQVCDILELDWPFCALVSSSAMGRGGGTSPPVGLAAGSLRKLIVTKLLWTGWKGSDNFLCTPEMLICKSLGAVTLSTLYLGIHVSVLSPLEVRIGPSQILSLTFKAPGRTIIFWAGYWHCKCLLNG